MNAEMNIDKIAQALIDKLALESHLAKFRIEGVRLLYDAIREEARVQQPDNEPAGTTEPQEQADRQSI